MVLKNSNVDSITSFGLENIDLLRIENLFSKKIFA